MRRRWIIVNKGYHGDKGTTEVTVQHLRPTEVTDLILGFMSVASVRGRVLRGSRFGTCDHDGFRFSRNALNPSWPSAETRRFAMTLAVVAAASAGDRPQISRMSALAAITASGPAVRISRTYSDTCASSTAAGHDRVNQADLPGAGGGEARAREKQLARGRLANFREDEGADDRRHDARVSPR